MQSLQYDTSGTGTLAVWPSVSASLSGSVSYDMVLSSDYGRQEEIVPLTLVNTPTSITPRLVFSFAKNLLPNYTGNYTVTFRERQGIPAIWGQLATPWVEYDALWSAASEPSTGTVLDTDRAWISGSDVPSFKEYTSPNETGNYTIYHL